MLMSILRSAGAVVAGVVLAGVLLAGMEVFGELVYPFPPGVDPNDIEVCRAHVATYPAWVLAVANVAWGGTAFVAPWLATRIGTGRHPAHGFAIGVLLFLMVAMNMSMLPYPVWFDLINLVAFPLATITGVRLGRKPAAAPPAVTAI
jgi:hypothetical protein